MWKNKSSKSKKVRGVRTASGKFLPFPLPVHMSTVNGVGEPQIKEMLLHYGDPNEWDDPPPLMVEVRFEFDLHDDLAKHLIERAKQLKVDVEALPGLAAALEQERREEKVAYKASRAASDIAFESILRWCGLREDKAPNGLRVPTRVLVGYDPGLPYSEQSYSIGKCRVAVLPHEAVHDSDLRERALKYLPEGSRERAEFVAYCEYWDQQHGGEWS